MLRLRWCSIVWLCGVMALCACEPTSLEHVVSSQAIIGGKPDLRYPAVGVILYNGMAGCTGTLIAPRVVLTAAHCVLSMPTNVRLGTGMAFRMDLPDASKPDGFRRLEVGFSGFFAHPSFTALGGGPLYDVGILILERAVTEVTPLPLYLKEPDAKWVGKELLYMGYGMIQSLPKVIFPDRKYSVSMEILQVKVDRIFGGGGGRSTCHVDSGGPVLVEENGKVYAAAVHSYGTSAKIPNGARNRCDGQSISCLVSFVRGFIHQYLLRYGDAAPACAKDGDCGECDRCSAGKSCEIKPVQGVATSCQPCRSDTDCPGGRCVRLSNGFRCVQPCALPGCCPSGYRCDNANASLTKGLCLPDSGGCKVSACGSVTDCGPGEECTAGKCAPKPPARSPKLCHPCWSAADCGGKGDVCIGGGVRGRCGQPCGAGEFCPVGFTCQLVSRGFPRQCVPEAGKSCGITCKVAADCPAGWRCQQGVCATPTAAKEGASCDATACEQGLICVATAGGKRCLLACGMPPGRIGTGCNADNFCPKGSVCTRSGGVRLCLGSCHENKDCAASGGGVCSSRVCVCQGDKDCQSGYRCAAYGVCVPHNSFQGCPKDYFCMLRDKGDMRMFCSSLKASGSRALGQTCDSWTHCQQGTRCYFTDLESHCLEECTTTNTCKYGGQCSIPQGGRKLCGCTPSLFADCPCQRMNLGSRLHSFCRMQDKEQTCRGGLDCPLHFVCEQGSCVFKSPPKPEPITEPATESISEPVGELSLPDGPASNDAGSIDRAKESPADKGGSAREPAPDSTTPDSSAKSGCGCQGSPTDGGPLGVWVLLCLFPLLFRRQEREGVRE